MINQKAINILAGMFAHSNMGFGAPTIESVAAVKYSKDNYTPTDAAIHFCSQYMESDEHEQIFCAEADMWAEDLQKQTEKQIKNNHPDLYFLYMDA